MRVKLPSGAQTQVTLLDGATWGDLLAALEACTGSRSWTVKSGYPSREIGGRPSDALATLGIRDFDSLVLETRAVPVAHDTDESLMVVRMMDDDNSCLFSAVAYVLEDHARQRASFLRQLVAGTILADASYTDAVLGRPKAQYAEWIQQPSAWGGAIELAVLARHYGVQIASIDVATLRMDVFGEGEGYEERVYLLYSGIHYDAIAESPIGSLPEGFDVTLFRANDVAAQTSALALAAEARQQHKYTDLARFTIRCETCGARLVGETDAERHAGETAHTSFVEEDHESKV